MTKIKIIQDYDLSTFEVKLNEYVNNGYYMRGELKVVSIENYKGVMKPHYVMMLTKEIKDDTKKEDGSIGRG